jgi:hypothetical protein
MSPVMSCYAAESYEPKLICVSKCSGTATTGLLLSRAQIKLSAS